MIIFAPNILKFYRMKKLKKIKLNQLNHAEMEDRAMNMLRAGNTCGCGCNGPSSKEKNYSSNWDGNLYSPDGSIICSWPGTGGGIVVYGGSKAPGMP